MKFKYSNKTVLFQIIFFLIGIVASCHKKDTGVNVIALDLNDISREYMNYSEFVDSISYVTLKESDDMPLGDIKTIRFLDGFIVVFDDKTQAVMLFDNDGNFVRKISERGGGPGEYSYIRQVDVDKTENNILLYDISKASVLKYTLDNVYLGSDSIGSGNDMAYVGDGNYLITNFNESDEDKSGIFLVSTSPYKAEKLIGCRDKLPISHPYEFFNSDGRVSVMTRPFEDMVLEWNGSKFDTVLNFNILQSPTASELQNFDPSKYYNQKDHIYRVSFVNCKNYFYTYFWLGEEVREILVDKSIGKTEMVKYLQNDMDSTYGQSMSVTHNNALVNLVNDDEEEKTRIQFLHLKN